MKDPQNSEKHLISICIPNMNRTDDLRQIMPSLCELADTCPPIEICILDYNSQDGLREYMGEIMSERHITYRRYGGRNHYHMAHARNLSVLMSHGEYVLISSCDIIIQPPFILSIRDAIDKGAVWTYPGERFVGVLCIRRQEFIDAGGYDERLEYYGKEDKDLYHRLLRRGKKHIEVPPYLSLIYTPWDKKRENYRGHPTRKQMARVNSAVYKENEQKKILVANRDTSWGQW